MQLLQWLVAMNNNNKIMTAIQWTLVIVGYILWYLVGYSQGIKYKKQKK
jgi:hypothetical protein